MGDEMADREKFETLLQSFMSPDNEVRKQAETTYESIPIENKVGFLLLSIGNLNVSAEVRQMAAVLFRRLLNSSFSEFFPKLAQNLQSACKEQLLAAIQLEPVSTVRRKICDAVAELARNLIDEECNNLWPDALKFLFDCASSGTQALKESALHILNAFPGIFGNQQAHYLDVIKQMLLQCLTDQSSTEIRMEAAKATISFVLAQEKNSSIQRQFSDLVPVIIQGVSESVDQEVDDELLKFFIELGETAPKMLRTHLETTLQLCLKIVGNSNLGDAWRQLGLEMLVTLAENAPAMLRKYANYIPLIVPQMLAMMVDLEDDSEWALSDEPEEEDSATNSIAGESALDRFACGIGGKTILPHIISSVPPMLQSADWRYRHAGLMAISAVGEGCHKYMETVLDEIVTAIIPFLQDEHPRVRYASCNAIGQMSTDFSPTFAKKFHAKVIPGLLAVMDNHDNPRVQSHAAAAMTNFSEECPQPIFLPYLDSILTKIETIMSVKLQELISHGRKLVLEQTIVLLAGVADNSADKFTAYYHRFIPSLKYIIQNAASRELRLLRGKTIECISLIGLAVGKDKFRQDAEEVMQLLLKAQTDVGELEDDDPQISYMISSWARMCKLLGPDFQAYLPVVMGPLMKSASLKPEVALVDSEDAKMIDDEGWQFVNLGDQQSFGLRTAGLEEKSTACQMLVCYAKELKEGFAEYAEQVVKLMVPLLKFYFHDMVRSAAAESLPFLLECAKIRGEQYLAEMWAYISPELLKAIQTEPETEVLIQHLESFAKCVESLGKGCLNEAQLTSLVKILGDLFEQHFKRQVERQEQRKDEDYDEVVEENLQDEDDDDICILSKIADIVQALLVTHGVDILPVFDLLLPYFVKLLAPDRPWADHQWALCIFDDVVEYCGPASAQYREYFWKPMLNFLSDKVPEVRQAAAYGCGILAKCGGPGFAQEVLECLAPLTKMIQEPESRTPENTNATENAISAVTKIMKYNHGNISVSDIVPHWLGWLPIWEDKEECAHVYNFLCDLIESNDSSLLGVNNANLPRIMTILAEAFVRVAVSDNKDSSDDGDSGISGGGGDSGQNGDLFKRMVNIVKQIQSSQELWGECIQRLSDQQQQALATALQ